MTGGCFNLMHGVYHNGLHGNETSIRSWKQ
jgi:hypothetical protein